jgi:hypothetical protein
MAPSSNSFPSRKHVCIFELERKGGSFTGDIVCTVCGGYLSSHGVPSTQEQSPQPTFNNEPHP